MNAREEWRRQVERSIWKTYRERLWNPFIGAIQRYRLIAPGDRVAVCVSGGKDSMLMGVLFRLLRQVSDVPFETEYLLMDPGFTPQVLQGIERNAALLELPLHIFQTNIFRVAEKAERSPCYLCARMRRGSLYREAQRLGCGKIALGHHLNDVIETTLMGMCYSSQLQAMLPKLHSRHFEGMTLIRPLYAVRERDIVAWGKAHGLTFAGCSCRFTERAEEDAGLSKRREIKEWIAAMQKQNPNIENSLFHAIHAVCLDTFPGYKSQGERHSFLEAFEESETPGAE